MEGSIYPNTWPSYGVCSFCKKKKVISREELHGDDVVQWCQKCALEDYILRRCLKCEKEFKSYKNMRICKDCKAALVQKRYNKVMRD